MPPSAFLCLPAWLPVPKVWIWATCSRPRQPRQSPIDSVSPKSYRFIQLHACPLTTYSITQYQLLSSHRTRSVPEQTHDIPMLGKLSQGPSAPPDPVALTHYRAAYSARRGPHGSTAFYFSLGVQWPPSPPSSRPLFHRFLAPPARTAAHLRLTPFPFDRLIIPTNARRNNTFSTCFRPPEVGGWLSAGGSRLTPAHEPPAFFLVVLLASCLRPAWARVQLQFRGGKEIPVRGVHIFRRQRMADQG